MATVTHDFDALAGYNSGANVAEFYQPPVSNIGAGGWVLVGNDSTKSITFRFTAADYSSGSITVVVHSYNTLASPTGSFTLSATIASQQPNVSTETAQNPVPATAATASPAFVTTQYAPQATTITVTATDGAANGFPCYLTITRTDANTAGVVVVYAVTAQYSDGSSAIAGPASSVVGNLASMNSTTGSLLADSGIAAANVNTTVTAGAANEIAVFSGTGKALLAGGTNITSVVKNTGPSVIDGNLVKFSGTSGLNILDSGIALTSVVTGPASAVSGNIASYNGTTGKIVLDSGVSATAHAARHNIGGADSLFTGTWAANDTPEWNGTIWVPKAEISAASAGTALSGGVVGMTDIPGLTLSIPRAGKYKLFAMLKVVMSGAAGQWFVAWNFTGTVTDVLARGLLQSSATGAASPSRYCYLNQIANNVQVAAAWTGTVALETMLVDFNGSITVSTTGTLSLRASRAATTLTLTPSVSSYVSAQEI